MKKKSKEASKTQLFGQKIFVSKKLSKEEIIKKLPSKKDCYLLYNRWRVRWEGKKRFAYIPKVFQNEVLIGNLEGVGSHKLIISKKCRDSGCSIKECWELHRNDDPWMRLQPYQ